jgi:hypothetical protein
LARQTERQALATLAVTQLASQELERTSRTDDRTFAMLFVSGLTLFAVAIAGYHPYAEDGGLYMAGVKRLLDPTLYPHGAAFVLEPTRFSLFAPMLSAIVRLSHLGLPTVLLALHLASIWATLFAAWMLASRCWPTRTARAGAVTLLACWLGLPIAGTALLFMDPYVTARSLSTPCMILALIGVLDWTARDKGYDPRRRNPALWLISIVLAAAMHPLMAAYALGASLVLMCMRSSRPSVRRWGTVSLCAASLGLAAALQKAALAESPEYIRVALTRTYWFLTEWRWYEVAGLIAPLAILTAIAWSTRRTQQSASTEAEAARKALAQMAIAVGATAAIVALLFARPDAATHLVARLQPLRIFQIVYLVMVLTLGARLGESILRRSPWRWGATLAILGITMLAAARAAYPASRHLELPWLQERNPWVSAFIWIRDNTPHDALFALDADYINAPGEDAQCFRTIAQRSALADYSKDGGEASIAPALTQEWAAEQHAQMSLNSETDAARVAALQPLGVSWVILDKEASTAFSCPYRNSTVQVCRLK